ncbi:MAG: MerR family transcriptional regulator [Gammaproteobacteria bacterium]|nr:MerR family transcriptional regulator [Gammaproteobacteria bacterium]
MLSSKQLIEITAISRATLNNYVALGILPNPVIRAPGENEGRATRLGYFDDVAVQRIQQVQQLKKQGMSMAQIAEELSASLAQDLQSEPIAASATGTRNRAEHTLQDTRTQNTPSFSSIAGLGSADKQFRPTLSQNLSFDGSIEDLPGPAYMVNNNFELIWWNNKAQHSFFNHNDELPGDLGSRNLLQLLFETEAAVDADRMRELLMPHLAAGKKRLSQQALMKIYSALDGNQLGILKGVYETTAPVGKEPMVHFPTMLLDEDGKLTPHDLYICFYREGIFFTYSPVVLDDNYLLEFLSKRDQVINELLKQRKPHLTDVTVMVADVQNSIKICSELPAEEYFELINNIWQESAPIFRKYYGTYGKHAGDGMVYYFFPQPDCDYKLNAIRCSLELQEMMKRITKQWQARKGWFSELFLNIGLAEGQEWFGSYHAGSHVEFTVLGETINYASRISDFARNGSVWATKNMLNKIPQQDRGKINFGITRKTQNDESVFVTDTYSSVSNLIDANSQASDKFKDIEMIPITELRAID